MSIVSESTDTFNGIPIVVDYDGNSTYATQNGVNYDKLTYELLLDEEKQSELKVSRNTPNGPIDRLLSDVLGLAIIYAGTFILCDLFRTFKKGRWTSLAWMFLGPWNTITGAPILHRISDLFGAVDSRSYAVSRCQSKYATAQKECSVGILDLGWWDDVKEFDDCMYSAEVNYQTCMENTPDFQQCQRQAEDSVSDGWGTYCDEQGDDNPTCYHILATNDYSETQDCLRAVGYDGVYYGPQTI